MCVQVVVDAIDPAVLVSRSVIKLFDFLTISDTDLDDIIIPLDLTISSVARLTASHCVKVHSYVIYESMCQWQ